MDKYDQTFGNIMDYKIELQAQDILYGTLLGESSIPIDDCVKNALNLTERFRHDPTYTTKAYFSTRCGIESTLKLQDRYLDTYLGDDGEDNWIDVYYLWIHVKNMNIKAGRRKTLR